MALQFITNPSDKIEMRDYLVKCLRRDLMGPSWKKGGTTPDPDDVLDLGKSEPVNYYLTGILLPAEWGLGEDEAQKPDLSADGARPEEYEDADRGNNRDDNDEPEDGEIKKGRTVRVPSSIGMSFVLNGSKKKELTITAEWGDYRKNAAKEWARTPKEASWKFTWKKLQKLDEKSEHPSTIDPDVYLHLTKEDVNNDLHVTARIVNSRTKAKKSKRSDVAMFQVRLTASYEKFEDARRGGLSLDTDDTMVILYHASRIYARGHNVGADWEVQNKKVSKVHTDWIPGFEVPRSVPNKSLPPFLPKSTLDDLSGGADYDKALNLLDDMIDEYQKWHDELDKWFKGPGAVAIDSDSHPRMVEHLQAIQTTVDRIRRGIELVRNGNDAKRAFQLANESMKESMGCPAAIKARGGKSKGFVWFPFQICFILLNLPGLLSEEGKLSDPTDKDIIDLAWYPTGGGKTEAYLGLVACIGFYRHLKSQRGIAGFTEDKPSVHAIMRYTLRLLTLNQGERAVRLVAGMNIVADKHTLDLTHKFSVGMWIGGTATPNKISEAKTIIANMIASPTKKTRETPIQLQDCPWCGDDISDPVLWVVDVPNTRINVRCKNKKCVFSKGDLPYATVDEQIYEHPPSFLIGTIDKFARLASVPQARVLLGLGMDRRSPDLVIQDELHLITGPLGSIAGLYETAIESLWHIARHRVKYVSATATIRGADQSTHMMYGRTLSIFPPPGRDIDDNFFAKTNREEPGRIHHAVIGNPGKARDLFSKPAASLLQRSHEVHAKHTKLDEVDPYWTMVAYFNSIRELSGALSLLANRIQNELIVDYAKKTGSSPRKIEKGEELFSRRTADELKKTLAMLHKKIGKTGCVDACLTTNMFQVGVDVGRLGLMMVVGQPKSNSEYIQASGRVGRGETPGLVLSLLQANKPRDLSHFEMHRDFHQEMYRYVDVTTTTPFSTGALDRALPSLLMLLARMQIPQVGENDKHIELRTPAHWKELKDLVDEFEKEILGRITDPTHQTDVQKAIRKCMLDLEASKNDPRDRLWRETSGNDYSWGQAAMSAKKTGQKLILDSMRDVGDEVFYGDQNNIFGKIRASDLLSNSIPGGLWDDKNGTSQMTEGMNKWTLDPAERQALELTDDALMQLIPGKRVMRPPTKADQRVTIIEFPMHSLCKVGHIAYGQWDKKKKGSFCGWKGAPCGKDIEPVRFVSLCEAGHIEPFDWNKWIKHKGPCKGNNDQSNVLVIKGPNAGDTLADWDVRCISCKAHRTLLGVTSRKDRGGKYCGGKNWWIDITTKESCEIDPIKKVIRTLSHRQTGSSSITMAQGGEILLIPPYVNWCLSSGSNVKVLLDPVHLDNDIEKTLLPALWTALERELTGTEFDNRIAKPGAMPAFDQKKFLKRLLEERKRLATRSLRRITLREYERQGLDHGNAIPRDDKQFKGTTIVGTALPDPTWLKTNWPFKSLSRIDRLTSVRYVDSITRLDGSGGSKPLGIFPADEVWILGQKNHGEGIYVGVKPESLSKWADDRAKRIDNVDLVDESFSRADWTSTAKEIVWKCPEIRKCLPVLHTISHLVIKQLCSDSGYSLGSIRERLYLESDDGKITNAGMFFYTTGSSSDGTLGGLSAQSEKGKMEGILERALKLRFECSNDPVCGENPLSHGETNGAACHACVLLPETCCELSNNLLDRSF